MSGRAAAPNGRTPFTKIRANHRRKTGFMPGFEALAADAGRTAEPSFLERAKTRWGVRHGKTIHE